jgi:hypothetical protein
MSPDILIVRDGDEYRVLHGHLHLASELSMSEEVLVDVMGEGPVKICKTRSGHLVGNNGQHLALFRN